MQFRILGFLEAETNGRQLPLGGSRERIVLATLLLDADRVVSVSHLVDAVWDDNPPPTAVKQVQNVVSRLRRMLTVGGEADPIITERGGYRIRIGDGTLDARTFEAMVARGKSAASAGDVVQAAAELRAALQLRRGPTLAGLSGKVIEASASAWDELLCAVQETYYDHRLALGEHGEIVRDLRELVAAHPLRERPVAQLMTALYRCGRQADALEAYATARELLAAELGLDPGSQLQHLQQQILSADPGLDVPVRNAGPRQDSSPPWLAVPRQLPASPRNFVGRLGELRSLAELLNEEGAAVVISAIGGTAGVGKTALAVHWAHTVAERFPDGQLYVNLRGFDREGARMSPAEAVRGFLTALNVPAERVPADLDEQAALYRSLVAGRRFLIIADNARDSAQVRPLLPGSPGCLVVVTSRSQLTGLVADGARMVHLGLLTEEESRQLLSDRVGRERLAAEPAAADDLIGLCAGLPLALSIAAAHAAARPRRPLAALATELRDTRSRLDILSADDTSVRAAFSWSYGQLAASAARMFRLLGLHPGPDISLSAAASLAAVSGEEARRSLAELDAAHLVREPMPGRRALHDLVRVYATERAAAEETAADRDAAIHRLLDYYLYTAHTAALLLHPARDPITLCAEQPQTIHEELTGMAEALAWFDAEHRVLRTAVGLAADRGFPRHAWQIAWTLANYLDRRGQRHAWRAVQQAALAAACKAGDVTGQAHAHSLLGRAEVYLGRHDDAREHVREALTLFESVGDRVACARAYLDLAWIADQQGRHGDATAPFIRALAMYRSIPHEIGEAHTLSNLGWHYAVLGNYQRALTCCREALKLHRAHGNVVVQAATVDTLGYIHYLLADYGSAVSCYEQAIAQLATLGARVRVARTLCRLGDTHLADHNPRAARAAWQEAVAIFSELGHPDETGVQAKLTQLTKQSVLCLPRVATRTEPASEDRMRTGR